MAALVASLLHGADRFETARIMVWVGGIWLVAAAILSWLALPGATVWGIRVPEFCLGMAGVGSALVVGGAIWLIVLRRRAAAESAHSPP